jgi:hypothetical protein
LAISHTSTKAVDKEAGRAVSTAATQQTTRGTPMTPEDEEFNRIEMESRIRKEAVLQALHNENERLGLYKDVYGDFDAEYAKTMTGLMEELAVARMLIRELGDRLAKLEKPWVGLTDEDLESLCNEWRIVFGSWTYEFAKAIEAKLKEKNNG